MIINLDKSDKSNGKLGNKGEFLLQMLKSDIPVPSGFILDSDIYIETIKQNGLNNEIFRILSELHRGNVRETSEKLCKLFDNITLPEKILTQIDTLSDSGTLYAVRSSGTMEDMADHSFAGQYETFLNTRSSDIDARVIDCYRSMFREVILSYIADNEIPTDKFAMSVVVQRMVAADFSGVCFTIDPTTGKDKEMLIEVSKGLGDDLVSGQTAPQQYYFDWYESCEMGAPKEERLISKEKLSEFADVFIKIQQHFGYPCDIEFAVKDGKIYILQARAITKLQYTSTPYLWTTADFKDGGVSATVCTPYMWSLYEYIWEYSLRKFIVDSKILRDDELPAKLGEMFYGRPYWNMSAVKKTMSQIVGYKEREFDNEYGIIGSYEGDGETTKATPRVLIKMIRIVYHQTRLLNDRRKNAERYKSELLYIYEDYRSRYDSGKITDITREFYTLTHDIYLRSETTYFWQIFINTIHQSLYKDSLLKYVSESEYLSLLGSIDNISHLLPFYDLWELSRRIRADKTALKIWEDSTPEEIVEHDDCYVSDFHDIIEKYGYHSDKELDITYPCYYETPQTVAAMLKDMLHLDDSYSPENDKQRGQAVYNELLEKTKSKVSGGEYKKIVSKVENMRRMLWWREEFRDVSTRFYYMLRMYTIEYAKSLVKKGVLEKHEDVWFLKVGDLWNYIGGSKNADDLRDIIRKNKLYYNAYRNYMSENEIGSDFTAMPSASSENTVCGLGANNGIVTGTARVIKDLSEIDRLQEGDILVTRFTDTGWTPKFAILSGIVTEYGGILCHAAIVSREYGIPAVVCCTGAMSRIRDGQTITVNGAAGEVQIGESVK